MVWFDKAKSFLLDIRAELKRTTFPSVREVRGTTTVVIITVFIFAFFLFVVDTFLGNLVNWIFRTMG